MLSNLLIQRRLLNTSAVLSLKRTPTNDPSDVLRTPSNVKPRTLFSALGRKFLMTKWDKTMGLDKNLKVKSQMVYLSNSNVIISMVYNPWMIGITSALAYIYTMGGPGYSTTFHTIALVYVGLMTGASAFYLHLAPLRLYYNEKEDRTFAVFAHKFVPFGLKIKQLPHGTFRQNDSMYSNGQMSVFLDEDSFRFKADLDRLLSQKQ